MHIHLNSEDKLFENKSLPLSMDEGFEDTRSGDFTKLPSLSQVALIDFSKSKNNNDKKVLYAINILNVYKIISHYTMNCN